MTANTRNPHCLHLVATCLLVLSAVTGCIGHQRKAMLAEHFKDQSAIEEALRTVLLAAETKDFDRLDRCHWYGPKFTKFVNASPTRLDAAAARQGEHEGLNALQDLKLHPRDLKIDVFGNTAVVTCILENSYQGAAKTEHGEERSTLVFVKDGDSWKIVHEHFSPIRSGNE
jgi:ketosteroid isomerase-like protein